MSLRLHVSEQGDFFTAAQLGPLADGRAITIHSSALLGISGETLAQFAAYTQAEVEASLVSYLAARGIVGETLSGADLVVLDMEEPTDAITTFCTPNALYRYSPADRTTCIEGWKLRIRAARAVMPRARLTMFGTLKPDNQGRATNQDYLDRLAALRDDAGPQGLFDGLDFLEPTLFTRWGPNDGAKWYSIEAWVRQALDGSAQLRKSTGASLPLIPIFTVRVLNAGAVAGSQHDDELFLDFDPTLERSLLLPMGMCEQLGVTEAVLWVAVPDGDVVQAPNPNGWTVTDYIRRLNMATTFKLIREKQISVIAAATPGEFPDRRFQFWEKNEPDFPQWADASSGPFRRFTILHGLDYDDERYLDQGTESVVHTATVLVAYPQVREFEGRVMDDVIDEDITTITKAIGTRGYGSYAALGDGEHVAKRIGCAVEERAAARVLRLTFQLVYDRTIS